MTLASDPAPKPSADPSRPPAVLVTGATGFIGQPLVRGLVADGWRVTVLTRQPERARRLFGAAVTPIERIDALGDDTRIDAVVHLAGAPVLGVPWTPGRREALVRSRTDIAASLVRWFRRRAMPPRVLVAASAVGYYGVPAGDAPVDETAEAQPGRFQSDLCLAVERAAQQAEGLGVRVVRPRFGIVLGHEGGAYPPMGMAAKFGLGAVLGSGTQPVPWVHRDDAIGLIRFAIDRSDLSGPVNAVAPDVRPQAEFAEALAASFQRKARLHVPAWLLRGALGEMSELLLCGQWAVPTVALSAGYPFRFPTLAAAAAALAPGA